MRRNTGFSKIVLFLMIVYVGDVFSIGDLNTAEFSHSAEEVKSFLQTDNAKLVFVCNNKLYYVDYSEDPITIHQMSKITSSRVIAPSISEDGNWVVYAAPGSDGNLTSDLTNSASVKSSAWICSLSIDAEPIEITADNAHVPRFVKGSGQLDIIYSTLGIWDAWKDKVGAVKRQNIRPNGSKDGSETTVYSECAMYGGMSYEGTDGKQYMGTAQGNTGGAWMVELGNPTNIVGLHQLQVRASKTAADYTTIQPQCCNPSITSSKTAPNTMMYLDFGSGGKYHDRIKDGQTPWAVHEIIFISNFSGEIMKFFLQPSDIAKITTSQAGELKAAGGTGGAIVATTGNTYEFPEWSNHPYYAITCVQTDRLWWSGKNWVADPSKDNSRKKNEYIYVINLKENIKMRLLHTSDTLQGRTTSYEWPWLWVEIPEGFEEDDQWLSAKLPYPRRNRRPSFDRYTVNGADVIRVSFDGQVVDAEQAIARVELHNMVGRALQEFTPADKSVTSVVVTDAFAVKPGVYFLRVELAGGQINVFRWVVTAAH